MKKKPKPTTGERIAAKNCGYTIDEMLILRARPEHPVRDLARRIDRAISSAVRKERERCAKVVFDNLDLHDGAASRVFSLIRRHPQ